MLMFTPTPEKAKIEVVTGRLEIELTPEMIEAGELALSEYDPEMEPDSEAVTRIFRAMVRARKEEDCQGAGARSRLGDE
jgi:hypothetical protein